MADAIVNLVLKKLADAAVNEARLLYSTRGKLDSLEHELRWIQAFLKDAEAKKNTDERVKIWVGDVREAAQRIEDVVDMFTAEFSYGNGSGKIKALKVVPRNPMKLLIMYKLTREMNAIEAKLLRIKKLTDKYCIHTELMENNDNSAVPMNRHAKQFVLPDVEDSDVVGLRKDTENIVNLLLDPNTTRRCVVSIVGQGGLGKTTLAKKAYNRFVCVHFMLLDKFCFLFYFN